jgi:hypothetical protein
MPRRGVATRDARHGYVLRIRSSPRLAPRLFGSVGSARLGLQGWLVCRRAQGTCKHRAAAGAVAVGVDRSRTRGGQLRSR